jgi:hypothetical protein
MAAAGAIALTAATGGLAAAQQSSPPREQQVHFLRYASEIADGKKVLSQTRDVLMARRRIGDRSLLIYDTQNGATTVERGGQTHAAGMVSRQGPETSFAYDYAGKTVRGEAAEARDFNRFVRPLLAGSPPLGTDAQWRVKTDLAAMGLKPRQGGALEIALSRTYFTNQGKPVVMIEFDIAPFQYQTPAGETVIHWARGFAVTDPGFGEIHALATQHRATALSASGQMRPISVKTSLHGIEADGRWRMRFDRAPQVAAAMQRLSDTAGNSVHPVAARGDTADPDLFAVGVANWLDFAAFAVAEDGANDVPLTLAASSETSTQSPMNGSLAEVQAHTDPAAAIQLTQVSAQSYAQGSELQFGATPQSDLVAEEAAHVLQDRSPLSTTTTSPGGGGGQAGGGGGGGQSGGGFGGDLSEVRVTQGQGATDAINAQGAGAFTQGDAGQGNQSAPEFETAAHETTHAVQQRTGLPTPGPSGGGGGGGQVGGGGGGGGGGGSLPAQLQPGDLAGDAGLPAWIEPNSAEAAEYLQLLEDLRAELDEAREPADPDAEPDGSGDSSLDQFVANNAFTYESMVGIVETDLTRWAEWLMTQNVRELERLALNAGYPNLASALADAHNIIWQSQDQGYREWARQAPSCGGYIGCGPSYLERWAMKSSIVALGDILVQSRDVFSSGGFSDIGISGFQLGYLLRDHALEDGDIVDIQIVQFGRVLYQGRITLTNGGQPFDLAIGRGVASLQIYAVNEGFSSPNTAQISVQNVVRGQGTQTYSLNTGETATLRIESGVRPGATGGSQ